MIYLLSCLFNHIFLPQLVSCTFFTYLIIQNASLNDIISLKKYFHIYTLSTYYMSFNLNYLSKMLLRIRTMIIVHFLKKY